MREHGLRELTEHDGANGHIVVARCTCGWSGSACFHDKASARNEHRIHAMRFIDGSELVDCCFCSDRVPARMATRLFAPDMHELRYLCRACTLLESPVLVSSATGPDLSGVRDDLIALERELRCG